MGEVALRFLQMGLESVKGTPVAATRILMARITNPNFNRPREFVEEDRGTLVGASRFIELTAREYRPCSIDGIHLHSGTRHELRLEAGRQAVAVRES